MRKLALAVMAALFAFSTASMAASHAAGKDMEKGKADKAAKKSDGK